MSSSPNVYAVILAGGSGTRFWPASRRLRPKQLLALAPGVAESLLEATVARLEGLIPAERIFVATGTHLAADTRRALPGIAESQILAEPVAKNTAPCIAWATEAVLARDPSAVVVVLPSDQHASDPAQFRRTLALAIAEAERGRITVVGIVPTRPETGYGYVKAGEQRSAGVLAVDSFVEKPNLELARSYVESGKYYWNAGMFIFRAGDMRAAISRALPELGRGAAELARSGDVEAFFASAQSISIDHGVIEKLPELSVVPGEFGWSDLGSWESVWELARKDERGNVAPPSAVLIDADRNLIVDLRTHPNPKEPPAAPPVVALVGTQDLCIVHTDDGLLVLPRARSQDVREVTEALRARGRTDLL